MKRRSDTEEPPPEAQNQFAAALPPEVWPKDASTAQPTESWTDLFNGKDLSGWLTYSDGNPATSWIAENGSLHPPAKGGGDRLIKVPLE